MLLKGILFWYNRKEWKWGTWVAQSIKHPTSAQVMIFCSGHDLTVHGFKPHVGLHANGAEPAWDSLSSLDSLSPPPLLALSVSLKINKLLKKFKKKCKRLVHETWCLWVQSFITKSHKVSKHKAYLMCYKGRRNLLLIPNLTQFPPIQAVHSFKGEVCAIKC